MTGSYQHRNEYMIEMVSSLQYTDIPKAFLKAQHTEHCRTNVIRSHCCAKRVGEMRLSHSSTKVAKRSVEAQGCQDRKIWD